MDIDSLSNSELRQSLLEHGIEAGPVTSTTRKLYTKKLAKIMKEGDHEKNTSTFEENISYVEQTSQSTSYYEKQDSIVSTPQVEKISHVVRDDIDDRASETSSVSTNSSLRHDYYPRNFTPTDRNLKRRPLPQLYKESTPIVTKTEKIATAKETIDGRMKITKQDTDKSCSKFYWCIVPLLMLLFFLGFLVYSHLEEDTFKMLPVSKHENKQNVV